VAEGAEGENAAGLGAVVPPVRESEALSAGGAGASVFGSAAGGGGGVTGAEPEVPEGGGEGAGGAREQRREEALEARGAAALADGGAGVPVGDKVGGAAGGAGGVKEGGERGEAEVGGAFEGRSLFVGKGGKGGMQASSCLRGSTSRGEHAWRRRHVTDT